MTSLIHTYHLFNELSITLSSQFCKNDSLVSRARNNLVAKALLDPSVTHVMFIDADIGWDPQDLVKLLLADKPIVGGVYPIKHYKWDRLKKHPQFPGAVNVVEALLKKRASHPHLYKHMSESQMIQYNMVRYNVNYNPKTTTIASNLAPVQHLPTGFMMIQRNTLTSMMAAYPATKYTDDVGFLKPDENQFAYALFDCGVEDGHYYSEDWMFCHRWSKMAAAHLIFMDVSIPLKHSGVEEFHGAFLASL